MTHKEAEQVISGTGAEFSSSSVAEKAERRFQYVNSLSLNHSNSKSSIFSINNIKSPFTPVIEGI